MTVDFAVSVKNILKTWSKGSKLAKKFGKSAATTADDDVQVIAESVEHLQRALDEDSEAVGTEYKRCLELCGDLFVNALVEDRSIQSQLKDLRADLRDQIDDIQDLVDEPEDFKPGTFIGVQTESKRIRTECIKVFNTVLQSLEGQPTQSSSHHDGSIEEAEFASVNSRHGSTSTEASSSMTRLRITDPEHDDGPPPQPKSAWTIDSPSRRFSDGTEVEIELQTRGAFSDNLATVPHPQDSSTFIPTATVDVRLKANDEFLERRRQQKIAFYRDKRISVTSIDENSVSRFDLASPTSPLVSPTDTRFRDSHARSSSDYTAFVQGQRGSTIEYKRASVASSMRTTSSTPGEGKASSSKPVAGDLFGTASPGADASSSGDGIALAATLKIPGYGTGVEDGLEPVNLITVGHDNEKITVDRDDEKIPVSDGQAKSQTPTSSVRSIDSPMRHDSSFYKFGGFCEGAKAAQRGELGYKIAKRPTGTYGSIDYAKCIKCSFEISLSLIEKDARMDVSGIYGSSGIRWRQQFLTKCHVRISAAEEALYACIFCIEDRKTPEEHDATVFFTPSQLFAHLSRHPRPLPTVTGITTLYGKVPLETTNFDLHFMKDQPTNSKYNLTEIAPEVAVRPSANGINTYHPKSSRSNKDPDGNPTLHFAAGARILGITFPVHLGGAWCVGYHDGEKGSFPSVAISLDLPSREDVFMSAQSSLVAFARWDFKPKEAKEGGWLKFSKGDKISNIGYTFQDQWCWSGQNKSGKWGLFPAVFVEGLQDSTVVGSPTVKSSGLLGFKKLGRSSGSISLGRSSGRTPSVRSGSSGRVPSIKQQPGLEVVVNGVVL